MTELDNKVNEFMEAFKTLENLLENGYTLNEEQKKIYNEFLSFLEKKEFLNKIKKQMRNK